jgi:8-oxo-dGTP diphosphatase
VRMCRKGDFMRLIRRITDSDVMGGVPEFLDTISRYGSRGVVVDNMLNIAMMYMSQLNLYKLPGGGIEEGENIGDAFLREINEETGYEAEIIHELGYIEEHKMQNDFMQISYCFVAKAISKNSNTKLSDNEKQLGMVVKWMTLPEALEVMNNSALNCDDYSTKFMIIRDKSILEEAVKILTA